MKKMSICTALAMAGTLGVGGAQAGMISDCYQSDCAAGYWGADDSSFNTDRVGGLLYEVKDAVVEVGAGTFDVTINTHFDTAHSDVTTTFAGRLFAGDLFLSLDGWNTTDTAPYENDNMDFAGRELWELVIDTDTGDIYNIAGTGNTYIKSSNDFFAGSGGAIRSRQEVQVDAVAAAAAGLKIGTAAVTTSAMDGSNLDLEFFKYSIQWGDIAPLFTLYGTTDIGLHWTMTCGNDVIEGGTAVPEPALLGLVGLGLAFLGFSSRRRRV